MKLNSNILCHAGRAVVIKIVIQLTKRSNMQNAVTFLSAAPKKKSHDRLFFLINNT